MKLAKLVLIALLGILLVSGIACGEEQKTEPTPTPTQATTEEGVINLTFNSSEYEITKDENNLDIVKMEEFYIDGDAGNPDLPYKRYDILVPPDVVWSSLELEIVATTTQTINGTYNIKPIAPLLECCNGTCTEYWWPNTNISDGRNIDVYENDSWFPAECVERLPHSQMRKWKFTKVIFYPFQYNPVSGNLILIKSASINISYERSPDELDETLMNDTAMDSIAPSRFFNYDEAKHWYLINETPTIQD